MRSFFLALAATSVAAAASGYSQPPAPSSTAPSSCSALPTGAGPVPTPDTAAAFKANQAFADAATGAATPDGYVQSFVNLQGANNAPKYLGYSNVRSYDVAGCAARCNAKKNCVSFNIYFERDPTVDPGSGNSGCANPPSTTLIKCAFYGGPIDASTAVNKGQWRNKFQVAIAGSNGYTKSCSGPTPPTSGNLLINGDFASGSLAPWTISNKSAEASITITNGVMNQIYYNSGTPFSGTDPYAFVYVQQQVALVVGTNYTIEYDYVFDNTDQVYMSSRVYYADGSVFQVIDQKIPQTPQNGAQYVHLSNHFVATYPTAYYYVGAVDVFYMDSAGHYTNFVLKRSDVQNGPA